MRLLKIYNSTQTRNFYFVLFKNYTPHTDGQKRSKHPFLASFLSFHNAMSLDFRSFESNETVRIVTKSFFVM